jgi:hypothetical protein
LDGIKVDNNAGVMKLVNIADLKSAAAGLVGSSPTIRTKKILLDVKR